MYTKAPPFPHEYTTALYFAAEIKQNSYRTDLINLIERNISHDGFFLVRIF